MTSLDKETGRDRYFAAKERELDALLDPATGMLSERYARAIACPLCGADSYARMFVKRGYTIVRCDECDLVYANPQVDEQLVLDQYREGGSSDLWVDVLSSARQLELDREKFSEILDELEPYRGGGRLLDVGCSIGLFLQLAEERGWKGVGTEVGHRALAYARDRFGLRIVDRPLADAGFEPSSFDVATLNSVLEHVHEPRRMLREVGELLEPGGALYLIVPNVESLACRVLHERAATFDGRNHLTYFSARTLREALEREGFQVVDMHTRISSLAPVLEWLCYREPYSGKDTGEDPLARELLRHADRVEALIEELDLGYKLHCLAVKPG
jgi:SAM-dependent methyltransferase